MPLEMNYQELLASGAHNEHNEHNDVRAEGKGRSVQRPRKRLKFENVLTIVPLLFLVCTRTCTKHVCGDFTKDEKSTRTLFVVKQRKER